MGLSATTEKARLCHSTSSGKVIYSQAVGTQFLGRHELFSFVKGLVSELEASFQAVRAVAEQAGLTCLLEPWAAGLGSGWPSDVPSGGRTPFADWI